MAPTKKSSSSSTNKKRKSSANTKRKTRSKMPPPDTLMTPTVVKILATSNMMTIKEVGRLGQTSKSIQGAIDDEVWKCILLHMDYKIPNDVAAALGHKWILQKATSNNECLTPSYPRIPPPRLSKDDIMIMYQIGYIHPDDETMYASRGTVTKYGLSELLRGGKTFVNVDPIVVGDAYVHSWQDGKVAVGPDWITGKEPDDGHYIWLNVHLVRIPDKQMCCILNNMQDDDDDDDDDDYHWNIDQWLWLEKLDDSDDDIELDTLDFQDPEIDNYFDFEAGWEPMIVDLSNFSDEPQTRGLRLQLTGTATEIMARFPSVVEFFATVSLGLTKDRKIEIIGFTLEATKRWQVGAVEWDNFYKCKAENKGVTLLHILSELECPE